MTVYLFLFYFIYIFIFKVIVKELAEHINWICLQHVLKVFFALLSSLVLSFTTMNTHPHSGKASLDEIGKGNKWRTSSLVLKLTYNDVLCYNDFLYGSIINKNNARQRIHYKCMLHDCWLGHLCSSADYLHSKDD